MGQRVEEISAAEIEASVEYGAVGEALTEAIKTDRALRQYSRFMQLGDLVFDLGANVGDRTAIFRQLGARVIAVEPQPSCIADLRRRFAEDEQVTIVGEAVAASRGTYRMQVSEDSAYSSMSPEWIEAVQQSGRASGDWVDAIEVPGTTLDELISEHGRPAFCKIDIEGYEAEVLEGLSEPLTAASFEFAGEAVDVPLTCIEKFTSLGPCEFALSLEESMLLGPWTTADEIAARVRSISGTLAWGDVYVRSNA